MPGRAYPPGGGTSDVDKRYGRNGPWQQLAAHATLNDAAVICERKDTAPKLVTDLTGTIADGDWTGTAFNGIDVPLGIPPAGDGDSGWLEGPNVVGGRVQDLEGWLDLSAIHTVFVNAGENIDQRLFWEYEASGDTLATNYQGRFRIESVQNDTVVWEFFMERNANTGAGNNITIAWNENLSINPARPIGGVRVMRLIATDNGDGTCNVQLIDEEGNPLTVTSVNVQGDAQAGLPPSGGAGTDTATVPLPNGGTSDDLTVGANEHPLHGFAIYPREWTGDELNDIADIFGVAA